MEVIDMPLIERPRRLRATDSLRRLTRETAIQPGKLIMPFFAREGLKEPRKIAGMPGVYQHSRDSLKRAVADSAAAGIGGVMLFGVPEMRDATGSGALDPQGVLSIAIADVKSEVGDSLTVMADLCIDEFTDHGHCGVLDSQNRVDNDATLIQYAAMARVLADAGAEVVGTSGMIDGQVGAVRTALDEYNRSDVIILAYAAKFASVFYGPFRNAVESKLEGDRRTYQEDPANGKEALREVRLDLSQGADIVMVKPALAYLDVISKVSAMVDVPVAAYIVSGEYAMIEMAAAAGAFSREAAILESVTSVVRAGAPIVCTYWANEIATLLRRN